MADTVKPAAEATEVAERIVDEIMARLRVELRPLVREAVAEALGGPEANPAPARRDQRGLLDILPLRLPPDHPALVLVSREEFYGDDGR